MNININRMGIFNQVKGNGDDIVNLERIGNGEGHELATNGKYRWYNPFRGIRSQKTIDANRLARETLLKNLRAAFGLQNNANYMEVLKNRIGDDILKSDDFDADANGKVHTSCPLTERRITAIIGRVRVLAAQERRAAMRPVADVTDEIVVQRKRFLQTEVGDRFFDWLKSKRTVNIVTTNNNGVSSVTEVKDCGFYSGSENNKNAEAIKTMMKRALDRQIGLLARSGQNGCKFSANRRNIILVKDSGGLIVEPFVNDIIIADGHKIKGNRYFDQLAYEKLDELIAEFNLNHPDLAIGESAEDIEV